MELIVFSGQRSLVRLLRGLKKRGESLRDCWNDFTSRLEKKGMLPQRPWEPEGYNYYLRHKSARGRVGNAFVIGDAAGLATADMGEGIGPAVESALLAARAISTGAAYDTRKVRGYSIISILGFNL